MPAASFFLQIKLEDGVIKGEAEEEGFEGAIEVSSWDWSVSDKKAKEMMNHSDSGAQSGTSGSGGGTSTTGGSGASAARQGQSGEKATQPTPVRFSKTTDRSTVRLLQAMYRDEKFKEAKFSLRQRLRRGTGSGEAYEEFLLELVLTKARITGYDFSAQAQESDVQMSENWEMSYDKIYYDYKSMPGRSVGPGKSVEFGPPDPTTKAPKQPQRTDEERDREIARLTAETERNRRAPRTT